MEGKSFFLIDRSLKDQLIPGGSFHAIFEHLYSSLSCDELFKSYLFIL